MKQAVYRKLSFILCIFIFVSSLLSSYTISFAFSPDDVADDIVPWSDMNTAQKWSTMFMFGVAQVKAIVNGDFASYAENDKSFIDYRDSHNIDEFVSDDGKEITIPQDFFEIVKQAIDDYAAENQPFKIVKTWRPSDIPASMFNLKIRYDYFKSLFTSGSYNYIVFLVDKSYGLFYDDVTLYLKEGGGFFKNYASIAIIDADWNVVSPSSSHHFDAYEDNDGNFSIKDEISTLRQLKYFQGYSTDMSSFYNSNLLITPDGGNIRVFNSKSDFINYSAAQRKIYYAKDYYDYTPQELTVSIDDLQKSVDGLSDAVEKLQQQITDDMSESEIENLLQQILDELKNNQGGNTGGDNTGGGSSGTGGGDVTVDIDLSTTNSLLERIHLETRSIFDEIHKQFERLADGFESFFIFEDAPGINAKYISSLLERILAKLRAIVPDSAEGGTEGGTEEETSWLEEVLEDIRDTLKSMRRWTIADTIVDTADAVADWADLILGVLKDAQAGADAAISSLSSSLGDTAGILSSKFPFCVPWDIFAVISFLKAEPEAPHFKLPIILDMYGIESYIEINMEPFQPVSDICRTMLALVYAYGLLMLTPKVIDIGKDML